MFIQHLYTVPLRPNLPQAVMAINGHPRTIRQAVRELEIQGAIPTVVNIATENTVTTCIIFSVAPPEGQGAFYRIFDRAGELLDCSGR
jgi:hypothetical protein